MFSSKQPHIAQPTHLPYHNPVRHDLKATSLQSSSPDNCSRQAFRKVGKDRKVLRLPDKTILDHSSTVNTDPKVVLSSECQKEVGVDNISPPTGTHGHEIFLPPLVFVVMSHPVG